MFLYDILFPGFGDEPGSGVEDGILLSGHDEESASKCSFPGLEMSGF